MTTYCETSIGYFEIWFCSLFNFFSGSYLTVQNTSQVNGNDRILFLYKHQTGQVITNRPFAPLCYIERGMYFVQLSTNQGENYAFLEKFYYARLTLTVYK